MTTRADKLTTDTNNSTFKMWINFELSSKYVTFKAKMENE